MKSQQSLLGLSILFAAVLIFSGCSSTSTGGGNATGNTVTFNLTASSKFATDGHPTVASLWNAIGDDAPVAYGTATFTDSTATVTVTGVPNGVYQIMVAVDSDTNGFTGSYLPEERDEFFGALNVSVTNNKTITVGHYYWQTYSEYSVIVAIDSIPVAQEGKIIGAGLFTNGYDPLGTSQPSPLAGGSGYVYNKSAVLAINMHGQGIDQPIIQIPNADYDVWCLVDINGTPEQWFAENQGTHFENGDLVDHYDFTKSAATDQWQSHTPHFTTLEATTVTFSLQVPSEWNLTGKTVRTYLYATLDDPAPTALDSAEITGVTTSIPITLFHTGTFQLIATVDADNSGLGSGSFSDALTSDDLLWGALDVPVSGTMTVTVSDSAWQHFQGRIYAVRNLPTGHNGQPFAIGLYAPGAEALSVYQSPLFAGAAPIAYNSAIVCINPSGGPLKNARQSAIPVTQYDAYCLIDVDGHMSDYSTGSQPHPISAGDFYYKETIDSTAIASYYEPTCTFLPVISVSGTVSCPDYTSGNIFVYLFHVNPLTNQNTDQIAMDSLTGPGAFTVPCLSNDSVMVVGFWDADGSGNDGGPTAGDLLGAYGVSNGGSLDSIPKIGTSTLNTSGKDFELWSPMPARKIAIH